MQLRGRKIASEFVRIQKNVNYRSGHCLAAVIEGRKKKIKMFNWIFQGGGGSELLLFI